MLQNPARSVVDDRRAGEADPLAAVELFAGLTPAQRSEVAGRCRFERFAAGRPVIEEGTEDRLERPDVIFVIAGRLRVINQTAGGRTVTFAEIGPGDVVGELAALDGGPRTAAVLAETDCRVARLSSGGFNELLQRHPPIAIALMRRLVRIIRDADQRISELSALGAGSRLCRELLRRSAPHGSATAERVVDPVPTQEQLASLTGTTRESVARLLGRLQHAGTVRRQGQRLLIADAARLAAIAELHEG